MIERDNWLIKYFCQNKTFSWRQLFEKLRNEHLQLIGGLKPPGPDGPAIFTAFGIRQETNFGIWEFQLSFTPMAPPLTTFITYFSIWVFFTITATSLTIFFNPCRNSGMDLLVKMSILLLLIWKALMVTSAIQAKLMLLSAIN